MIVPSRASVRRTLSQGALLLLLLSSTISFCGCVLFDKLISEEQFNEDIDEFVVQHMDLSGSGLAYLFVKDGKIAFTRGWGQANIESKTPFTPDTPCDVASVSKQFTAAAVSMLYSGIPN